MPIRRALSVIRAALGLTLIVCLAAAAPLRGQPRAGDGAEPPDTLPPPLIAPVIVPPGEEPELAPRSGPVITFEERVLELVNLERLANGGLPPLKGVSELNTSAESHSFNMADRDFFAHCDLDTKQTHSQRMSAAGYAWNIAGENIGAGYATPEEVMAGWMASSGHRASILGAPSDPSRSWREIGVGYFEQAGDQATVRQDFNGDCDGNDVVNGFPEFGHGPFFRYWTQNFGRRNGVYPLVVNHESHDTVCAELKLYVFAPANATQMRFSNDGVSFSAWEPYSPNKTWPISGASASPATVFSEVMTGTGSTLSADDEISLAAGFPAAGDLDISAQTVSSTETFEACDTISAGDGFEVGPTGDVTFLAGNQVVLRDGFSVASGGSFTAGVDPTL